MRPTLVIFFCILFSTISFAQEKKEIIADINNMYLLIKELIEDKTLRQHTINYICKELQEQGTLSFYYNSRELKYIKHQYIQEQATYKDEYYIWNNELFLYLSKNQMKYQDYEKNKILKTDIVLTMEEQYRFHNSRPIQCLFKEYKTKDYKETKSKTNSVKNEKTDCEQAEEITEKYNILLQTQNLDPEGDCTFPKSLSK